MYPEYQPLTKWQRRRAWLLLLPAALCISLAAESCGHFSNQDDWFGGQLAMALMGPIAFVYVGASLAPRRKHAVAIVMAVLYSCIFAVMTVAHLIRVPDYPTWAILLFNGIRVAAAAGTAWHINTNWLVILNDSGDEFRDQFRY